MNTQNKLANETSVYLLQHADNPVNWYPWGDEALEKAKRENKPLIVSIGYSACHWCHVMAHESFEDREVAKLMNKYFICIKVDREERPDIDQVYMDAVQLMTGSGGWPLNCFALPNGRPFWGGTYFPKEKWKQILVEVNEVFTKDHKRVLDFAEKLKAGVEQNNLINISKDDTEVNKELLDEIVEKWSRYFDDKEGGNINPPKFPLPNNQVFLFRYAHLSGNKKIFDHVNLTLRKMAYGGIYDHLGGGFARYSTDAYWKVPHFEKMLYDNAQMVSLYSEAYQATKESLYKKVVFETLEFIRNELTSEEGVFYSSLDADSEGKEGNYYVWKMKELQEILKEDLKLFSDYYNINSNGLWEEGKYILLRHEDDDTIAEKNGIAINDLEIIIERCKKKLLNIRNKRIRPNLDDNALISWNALMIKAYADAYYVFKEKEFLDNAISNAMNIINKATSNEEHLFHTYKNGTARINGFLDDYAFTIEAFIRLYEVTFDNKWLRKSEKYLSYVMDHFFDKKTGMFFFTSDKSKIIVNRKIEIYDNVIPSSNSSLTRSLFLLGSHTEKHPYKDIALRMFKNVKESLLLYGSSFSNWGNYLLNLTYPFYEIVIIGENAMDLNNKLSEYYLPNKLIAGAYENKNKHLPLFKNRYKHGKTLIYLCKLNQCMYPVETVKEVIDILE